ncbi:hypothetical protein [Actinoplanes awajinensis]|nr:hypothetical protein [Actinoplanes awajinensis]
MVDGEDITPPEHHVIRSSDMASGSPPQGLTGPDFRLIEKRALLRTGDGAAEIHEWVTAQPMHGHVTLTMVHYVLKMVRRPRETPLPETLR